jgi:hypothetical protein
MVGGLFLVLYFFLNAGARIHAHMCVSPAPSSTVSLLLAARFEPTTIRFTPAGSSYAATDATDPDSELKS